MSNSDPEHARDGVPDELTDADRGERLQKVMAHAGVASRRDCEKMVLAGRVAVNGRPVTDLPAWVDPRRDRISVDGREVARPPKPGPPSDRRTHLLLNKPAGVISTTDDPRGRPTVIDLVDTDTVDARRLFPVGRLDADSTGLILLTDDGTLANRLTHPRYEVEKRYEVLVKGRVEQADLEKLRKGLVLAHRTKAGREPKVRRASVAKVAITDFQRDRAGGDRTRLDVTLTEGQNREIRRLLARLDHDVKRLKRVAIGPLTLKGIGPGAWRTLTRGEVRGLYEATGLDPQSDEARGEAGG